jgi:hypothetical protein
VSPVDPIGRIDGRREIEPVQSIALPPIERDALRREREAARQAREARERAGRGRGRGAGRVAREDRAPEPAPPGPHDPAGPGLDLRA